MTFREETGWLIEIVDGGVPAYWGRGGEDGVLGWTADHIKALRFARKEDAEMVIEEYGWTRARAVDHMWCDYSHAWEHVAVVGHECCKDCGIVRRADDKNGPCRGPMKLRPMEKSWPVSSHPL